MNKVIILDGGMGTMLQSAGMPAGERPDIFGMQNPDIVKSVHEKYIEAGAEVIYSNTFGSNSIKLAHTGYSVTEVVKANVKTAIDAAEGRVRVALDIGPIGEMLEPLGPLSFDRAYSVYAETVKAGAECGADLIVLETFTDLADARAALLAAKENSDCEVWVTMSFEEGGVTFTGTSAECAALSLTALGADAVGINCSLGPAEIFDIAKKMSEYTHLPLVVKPNAGLPDPVSGEYSLSAKEFAAEMGKYRGLPLLAMGGCCGTDPSYIAQLDKGFKTVTRPESKKLICSSSKVCNPEKTLVIGERINPTGKKRFQAALKESDMNYIMARAIEQAEAGADILDINVGLPGIDEPEMMKKTVLAVSSVTNLPLQIDSSSPEATEAGLRYFNGVAIVNSVNGDDAVMEKVFPLVKKYGAFVVGLTLDKRGIPQDAKERIEIAERIIKKAAEYGIDKERIIIDCLTLTVSAQAEQCSHTLSAMREIKQRFGVRTTLGVSNISFGLPSRVKLTQTFLAEALGSGLDFAIVNPNTPEIIDTITAHRLLSGQDEGAAGYLTRFADETPVSPSEKGAETNDIKYAVIHGLAGDVARITKESLSSMSEEDVINKLLIPALDEVGERYESGRIFLPQLISSANAACAGFDIIKNRIAESGARSISKGKIVIATVEGDIHDIGKNIVRVVLENYGYTVIDLGKNVPVEKVVEETVKNGVRLVGLSALMSTTVPAMKKTIDAIRRSGHDCKIMVGGAVLTPDSADEIGADYYAKDAKASVDIAKEVFG